MKKILLVTLLALGISSAALAEEGAGAAMTRALGAAPIGSCGRCGRNAYSPNVGENFLVTVEYKGRRASGCLECILDAIAAPVTSCAR